MSKALIWYAGRVIWVETRVVSYAYMKLIEKVAHICASTRNPVNAEERQPYQAVLNMSKFPRSDEEPPVETIILNKK